VDPDLTIRLRQPHSGRSFGTDRKRDDYRPKVLSFIPYGTPHGATPRQIALRFLLRWKSLFTIPKSADARHTVENAGGGDTDLRLSEAEIARIDAAFPPSIYPEKLPVL
jgi:diketogulonate reductase-like aldo/keto reductase